MTIIAQPTGDLSRAGHRLGQDTGELMPLHIEEYGGEVESQFVKRSIVREYFTLKTIRGTDTVTNDRIGKTQLQKVVPGVRPESFAPQFDNISVKVDTIVLARSNTHLLEDFTEHYSVRTELGKDHGKEIGKFFDEAFMVQGVKASQIVIGDGTLGTVQAPDGFQSGTQIDMDDPEDELDPDLLLRKIEDAVQTLDEKEVESGEAVIFVRPAQFRVLARNDKLISSDYSTGNGDRAKGTVLEAVGIRIVQTNRLPNVVHTGVGDDNHYLSNAGNNFAYNVTQRDTECVCLIISPKALLAGETIPLTSKVYYVEQEMQWFIDSYLAFAATPNRAEHSAGVYKKIDV